ncbi:MAG TPA: prolyl oligopeptidase family serine peptidase, partial [Candidatus Edwardsbacteria bacterium]|nr:prolyl oligopeptidase family serine peptidase [Candidatus Edwardsbacteria bacterium]
YLAFGRAAAGNESPRIRIMEVATKAILPDTLRGWRQHGGAWLPGNSGFFYSAYPLKGTVPAGEEYYWQAVYFHALGTPADSDRVVFSHPSVKEYYHDAAVSENGRWAVFQRGMFNKSEVFLRRLGGPDSLVPVAMGFDAEYGVDLLGDTLLIRTDKDAPRGMVYVTAADRPGRENWKVLIPQSEDKLENISGIDGLLYAAYLHNAHTVIKIFDLNGNYLRDLPLPGIGSGFIWGYWSKGPVWAYFTSFNYPGATFRYDPARNRLTLYQKPPIAIDPGKSSVEQVWFTSRDGTRVPMFLFQPRGTRRDGHNAVLLTGYGGFDVPETPFFSSFYQCWLEAGGMVAIPNLRGGGEFGKDWHEAGMRDRKQNVFDDFIAAAQWLVDSKYTSPGRLAISGASNGGLLTGAVTAQRPDLFRAAHIGVPLLDMVRFHKFGYANVWAEEYGSAEDSTQFRYLLKYSPYHNVKDGTKYPAVLLEASENDARVAPLHARKMAARLQAADTGGGPILYLLRRKSGHGGGTRLTEWIGQEADILSFLMRQVGLKK